jgi:hypothetical protein
MRAIVQAIQLLHEALDPSEFGRTEPKVVGGPGRRQPELVYGHALVGALLNQTLNHDTPMPLRCVAGKN